MSQRNTKSPIFRHAVWGALALFLCYLLTGCLEVKEVLTIQPDGSANAQASLKVDPQYGMMVAPELRKIAKHGDIELKQLDDKGLLFESAKALKPGEHYRLGAYGVTTQAPSGSDTNTRYTLTALTKIDVVPGMAYEVEVHVPGNVQSHEGLEERNGRLIWNRLLAGKGATAVVVASSGMGGKTMALVAAAGLGLLICAGAAFWFMRRSKKVSPSLSSDKQAVQTTVVNAKQLQATKLFCTRCGHRNDAGSQFCESCGTALGTKVV